MVLVLTGFFVGVMIGLTSMGAAALMTPILILFFGVRPLMAIGTDLAFGAITKIFGAYIHFHQGTVDWRIALRLAAGSVPAGLAGVAVVEYLKRRGFDSDLYARRALGAVLAAVALILLFHLIRGRQPSAAWQGRFMQTWGSTMWGAVVGFAVGLTSVGSGSLMAPFLIAVYPLAPAAVVGTDVFHAALLVSVSAAAHWSSGNVDWQMVARLLAGSLPGVAIGSMLAGRIPARVLRFGLAGTLLITAVKMI